MKKSVIVSLHLGYWMMYLLLLFLFAIFFAAPTLESGKPFHIFPAFLFFCTFAITPGLAGFYSFYTFLFSKFLNKKKITGLFIYGVLVALVCGILGGVVMTVAHWLHFGPGIFNDGMGSAIPIVIIMAFNALVNGIIGLVLRGFIVSYGDIKLKEDLNKKNYEMELALVKSRINPHFLFNTINNIDVLIEKDAAKASAYLNKLSDIMRFMLYETKTEKIELTKELTYIEKYIDLQKIRTTNPNYVNYAVQGNADNRMIAPMLFIPFIENAFKHAENKRVENAISIKINIEKEQITFECENNYTTDTQTGIGESGLGNELIQKRLALLYPGKHTLQITDKDKTYKVRLVIRNEN